MSLSQKSIYKFNIIRFGVPYRVSDYLRVRDERYLVRTTTLLQGNMQRTCY